MKGVIRTRQEWLYCQTSFKTVQRDLARPRERCLEHANNTTDLRLLSPGQGIFYALV